MTQEFAIFTVTGDDTFDTADYPTFPGTADYIEVLGGGVGGTYIFAKSGGGAACSRKNNVALSGLYNLHVGAAYLSPNGVSQGAGEPSYFGHPDITNPLCKALAMPGGGTNGGAVFGSKGDIIHPGGKGGIQGLDPTNAGGGAAGVNGAGADGSGSTGGNGDAGLGGVGGAFGVGGSPGTEAADGSIGSGGGGGQGADGGNFGSGGGAGIGAVTRGKGGYVVVAWTPLVRPEPDPAELTITGYEPVTNYTSAGPGPAVLGFFGKVPHVDLTPPPTPGPASLSFFGWPPVVRHDASLDYNVTVISQYMNSPTLLQIVQNMAGYLIPDADFNAFFDLVWNVNTAQGYGLDVWGRIVGVGRVLHIPGDFGWLGWEEAGDANGWDQAPWFGGVGATQNYTLGDDAYRALILAKALSNICDGSIPAINQILMNLFGSSGGNAYVVDNLDMTISFTFTFPLTPVQLAIVTQSGVLPKPAGVAANVVSP